METYRCCADAIDPDMSPCRGLGSREKLHHAGAAPEEFPGTADEAELGEEVDDLARRPLLGLPPVRVRGGSRDGLVGIQADRRVDLRIDQPGGGEVDDQSEDEAAVGP